MIQWMSSVSTSEGRHDSTRLKIDENDVCGAFPSTNTRCEGGLTHVAFPTTTTHKKTQTSAATATSAFSVFLPFFSQECVDSPAAFASILHPIVCMRCRCCCHQSITNNQTTEASHIPSTSVFAIKIGKAHRQRSLGANGSNRLKRESRRLDDDDDHDDDDDKD